MIINDLNAFGRTVSPDEADSPLIVNADAVLHFSIAAWSLKMVTRRYPQVFQFPRAVQVQELSPGHPFNGWKTRHILIGEQPCGIGTAERPNH